MKNFKNLKVWEKGFQIAISTYKITKKFSTEEKYGLTSQMNRASISITSNIAEGSSRRSEKDYFRFLEIALGSCFELESQLLISTELEFIEREQANSLLQNIDEEQKMLIAFMKKLNN
ncbi:MAG: four helix bundle protein [Bacteroidales bacterium]|jgi:four helix bundle protein|nr:four helix bundle protein [Bacteroidales bacterium]